MCCLLLVAMNDDDDDDDDDDDNDDDMCWSPYAKVILSCLRKRMGSKYEGSSGL